MYDAVMSMDSKLLNHVLAHTVTEQHGLQCWTHHFCTKLRKVVLDLGVELSVLRNQSGHKVTKQQSGCFLWTCVRRKWHMLLRFTTSILRQSDRNGILSVTDCNITTNMQDDDDDDSSQLRCWRGIPNFPIYVVQSLWTSSYCTQHFTSRSTSKCR